MLDGYTKNVNDTEKIQKELLWGLYQEFRNHARHSETLRSTVNNYMLLVASALITVVTFDNKIDRYDLPLSLIVVFIGLLGALFSASYTERYGRNRRRALEIAKQLNTLFFEGQAPITLAQIQINADTLHRKDKMNLFLQKTVNTHLFWVTFPLVVLIIGIVLTILSWFGG